MFHSVKQHGPASVNCFQMRQKFTFRYFPKIQAYSQDLQYILTWSHGWIFSFSPSIADGSQNKSVGSRFWVTNPSELWWPIDQWNELIFILTSFVLVLAPPLVPSGSNSKVVQIRIRILCAIEEIWNFLFIYRKKTTRWWPWPQLTLKFNRKSFKEIQISWVGSGNKWPSEILPTPNLAKNNCHEIKQINLF